MDQHIQAVVEESLSCILDAPRKISQDLFVSTYNTVYRFCTAPSATYCIKGEPIFELIERRIEEYTGSLRFTGTTADSAKQLTQFKESASLLAKTYSYLERFYIRTSMFKKLEARTTSKGPTPLCDSFPAARTNVEPLASMFFKKIYFNYLRLIEENLQALVFAELDVYRSQFQQNCNELASIVEAYTHIIVQAGQDELLARFHKLYLQRFMKSIDPQMEFGKLLRCVYLEMFYASNIIGEKSICREIVALFNDRAESIFEYTFAKIRAYEPVRHIFKIISVMDEQSRSRLRAGYEKIICGRFNNANGFEGLYDAYRKTRTQIESNRMAGWMDLLSKVLKSWLKERGPGVLHDISRECVLTVDSALRAASAAKCEYCAPPELLDFAVLLDCDVFLEIYVKQCQLRLLSGLPPANEFALFQELSKRLGPGPLSRLSSSIDTYLQPVTVLHPAVLEASGCFLTGSSGESSFSVSLLKHTLGFWPLRPDSLVLPDSLQSILDSLLGATQLNYRECILFNLQLSPIIVKINGTLYRMNTDVFSLYHRILSGPITLEALETLSGDPNAAANVHRLVKAGLITEDKGRLVALNPNNGPESIDLFEISSSVEPVANRPVLRDRNNIIVKASICRLLKKKKEMSIDELYKSVNTDKEQVDRSIEELSSNGYISYENGIVKYIP